MASVPTAAAIAIGTGNLRQIVGYNERRRDIGFEMARPNGSRNVRGWTATPKDMQKAGVSLAQVQEGLNEAQSKAVVAAIQERRAGQSSETRQKGSKPPGITQDLSTLAKKISSPSKTNIVDYAEKVRQEIKSAGLDVNDATKGRLLDIVTGVTYADQTSRFLPRTKFALYKVKGAKALRLIEELSSSGLTTTDKIADYLNQKYADKR